MHRKFIALIIGTAITITGLSAVPARADGDDVGKVLAGLAFLAIIGAVIESHNDDPAPVVVSNPPPAPQPWVQPRPLPPHVAKYQLPSKCVRQVESSHGPRNVLGAQCLTRHYRYARTLPASCVVNQWNANKHKMVTTYGLRCLQRQGYVVARD